MAEPNAIEVTLEDMPTVLDRDSEEELVADVDDLKVSEQLRDDSSKPKDPEPVAQEEPEREEKRDARSPVQLFPVPAVAVPVAPVPEGADAPKDSPKDKEAEKPPVVEPPKKDQQIAVKQQVKDKNQQDNPEARFIGDEANRVDEETVARITSHDQDDANPTPGGQHSSESKVPGNADETRIADSEDREGTDRAPGEGVADSKPGNDSQPPSATAATDAPGVPRVEPTAGGANRAAVKQQAGSPPVPVESPGGSDGADGSEPMVVDGDGDKGAFTLDPRKKGKASDAVRRERVPTAPRVMGLGVGANERGSRTSLSMNDAVAAVGVDELSRQRAADGERRRSLHRGSWNSSSLERWRAATENYVSSVKPGNQTALNTAQVPFATYLVHIHNRLHPVFADRFLGSLDGLPRNHPLNNYEMMARLEIVVEPEQGRVVKMGVIKTSGVTAFDVAALDSVHRSGPFGKAPSAIVSPDGKVYLHWEFHRNPIYACSTMNAYPYMLNVPAVEDVPKGPPSAPKPPPDPKERGPATGYLWRRGSFGRGSECRWG